MKDWLDSHQGLELIYLLTRHLFSINLQLFKKNVIVSSFLSLKCSPVLFSLPGTSLGMENPMSDS